MHMRWRTFPQVSAVLPRTDGISPQLGEQPLHTLDGVFHTEVPVIHRDLWTAGLGFVGGAL